MITVYTVSYNEELLMQFMIDHYKERFPNCQIVLFDNYSTDKTTEIAKYNGCEIKLYDTNNKINEHKYLEIKNNCWKSSQTDWVLVCDIDELLDITQSELEYEDHLGSTIIKSEGYNMVSLDDSQDLFHIKYGIRSTNHDKSYLFNKKSITNINYDIGCHVSSPNGMVKMSEKSYLAYHYHFLNKNFVVNKYKRNAQRLSEENIENKWGYHYMFSEKEISDWFINLRENAVKIRG